MQDERAAEERQRYEAQAAAAREEADRVAAEQQFEPQDITEEQRLRFVRTRVQLVKGVLSESDIAELDATYERIKTLALHQADAAGTDELTHPNLGGLKDSPHLTCFLHVHALIDKQLLQDESRHRYRATEQTGPISENIIQGLVRLVLQVADDKNTGTIIQQVQAGYSRPVNPGRQQQQQGRQR